MHRPILERVRLSELSTPLVFVVTMVIFSVFSPGHRFLDLRNLGSLAKLTPDLGIVTLGIGILMICGEFDLSIASVLPFCSFIFVRMLIVGINPFLGLVLTMIVGAIFGLINGVIVGQDPPAVFHHHTEHDDVLARPIVWHQPHDTHRHQQLIWRRTARSSSFWSANSVRYRSRSSGCWRLPSCWALVLRRTPLWQLGLCHRQQ